MIYLIKFTKNGKRIATHPIAGFTDVQIETMLNDGFIEVEEKDWLKYCDCTGGDNGTGYVRDMTTGKPVSAPPAPKPSKAQRISQLEQDYSKARFELGTYYMEAVLDGNVDVQKDLQTELSEVKEQFESDVAAIMSEEE